MNFQKQTTQLDITKQMDVTKQIDGTSPDQMFHNEERNRFIFQRKQQKYLGINLALLTMILIVSLTSLFFLYLLFESLHQYPNPTPEIKNQNKMNYSFSEEVSPCLTQMEVTNVWNTLQKDEQNSLPDEEKAPIWKDSISTLAEKDELLVKLSSSEKASLSLTLHSSSSTNYPSENALKVSNSNTLYMYHNKTWLPLHLSPHISFNKLYNSLPLSCSSTPAILESLPQDTSSSSITYNLIHTDSNHSLSIIHLNSTAHITKQQVLVFKSNHNNDSTLTKNLSPFLLQAFDAKRIVVQKNGEWLGSQEKENVLFYVAGNTPDPFSNKKWALVAVRDGVVLWAKYGEEGSVLYDVNACRDGGVILVGSHAQRQRIGMVLKINQNGHEQWTYFLNKNKEGGKKREGFVKSVIQPSDGGVLIAFHSQNQEIGDFAYPSIVKLNDDGKLVWEASYPSQGHSSFPAQIIELKRGGYCLLASFRNQDDYENVRIIFIDQNGQLQWEKIYDFYGQNEFPLSMIEKKDGGFLILGNRDEKSFYFQINEKGNLEYQYEFEDDYQARSLIQTQDGGVILTGSYHDNLWIFKN